MTCRQVIVRRAIMLARPILEWRPTRALIIAFLALIAAACAGATPVAPTNPASPSSSPTRVVARTPSSAPTVGAPAALVGTKIVFVRDEGWPPMAYSIDPDGSNEVALPVGGLQPGIWSRDGTRLLVPALQPAAPEADSWMRPVVVSADGSTATMLDADPARKVNLVPVGWSSDETRIFVYSGYDAADLDDIGLFSVRALDGGDLTSVVPSPPGDAAAGIAGTGCARPDFVHVSPDGAKLLINRESLDGCGNLLLLDADGSNAIRLNPDGTVAVDLEFGDFVERPRFSEAFSPDGSEIAFTAYVTAADSTALYVVASDGTGLRQIVPTATGAVTAQWSPDGRWIAFTSKLRSQPQVWIVGADGTGLAQLTDGADGSASVMPTWSPDGTRLLFERKQGDEVTLWTMNADGTDATELSTVPISKDYFGPIAWWPRPPD
jgi:dipeptidyl aminopeptidase/acylaminoacyl peptidase